MTQLTGLNFVVINLGLFVTVNKSTAIFLLLLIPVVMTAQKAKPKNDSNYDERLLHFGFSMGANTMDFNMKMKSPDRHLDCRCGHLSPA